MFRGKNYKESAKLIDKQAQYEPQEAFELITKTAKAKFDETVELHVKLGVDSRHADQQVRGAIVLPHGTGKTVRVLAICKGDAAKDAEAAGAEFVGAEDMIQKIQSENWMDFDVLITTPDMMGLVGRLGRLLGPRSSFSPELESLRSSADRLLPGFSGANGRHRLAKGLELGGRCAGVLTMAPRYENTTAILEMTGALDGVPHFHLAMDHDWDEAARSRLRSFLYYLS